jgi:ATP-dependent Clp protease adaptor protein ClpS
MKLHFDHINPSSGIAVDEETTVETDILLDIPWQVLVYNDPVNLMGYVTLVIQRIFGYSEQKAKRMMLEVHHQGHSVVWTGDREKAELYVQQLHSHQLMAAMRRSP